LDLSTGLNFFLENQFGDGLKYEVGAKSKRQGDVTIQVLHRYRCDRYELVMQKINKNKNLEQEKIMFSCDPDPFVVDYHVNKVEIEGGKVRIMNKVREGFMLGEF
jgi:phage-related protein